VFLINKGATQLKLHIPLPASKNILEKIIPNKIKNQLN